MKFLMVFACCLIPLVALAGAPDIPPLPGDVSALAEPPRDAPHGPEVDGLSLAVWSEKPSYEINTRMNVWIVLKNTKKDKAGHLVAYDPAIHKKDFLVLTAPGGKQTKIKGEHPGDGPVGLGFAGGVSAQLHPHIRSPGVYKLQWTIGALRSNEIAIEVTPAAPPTRTGR